MKIIGTLLTVCFFWASCNKTDNILPVTSSAKENVASAKTVELLYGDSIFYPTGKEDYVIKPARTRSGKYFAFPEGLEINAINGAISIGESELGLKYRVSFVASGSKDTITNYIVLSGINYLDGFYILSENDSVAKPLYNVDSLKAIPGINHGSGFDLDRKCNKSGCNVSTVTGSINLAQTVRNGVFGKDPKNNDRHEFLMSYKLNDKSGKSINKLNVKLYYYNSMKDVPKEAYDIIKSRRGTILGANNNPIAAHNAKKAKPRPPCIFIVGSR